LGSVADGLGESRVSRPERAVDLVGAHVQKPKTCLLRCWQALPIRQGCLQQAGRAQDIGGQKGIWARDGPVYVRLSGKVDDGARLVTREQRVDLSPVTDVTLDENMTRRVKACEVVWVAGVGELVQVQDRLVRRAKPAMDKVAADEAGTAGDENGHINLVKKYRFKSKKIEIYFQ
jgi:hypothetical protein